MKIRHVKTGRYLSLRQLHIEFPKVGSVPDITKGIRGSWADPQNPTKEELESIGFTYETAEELKAKKEATLTEAVKDFAVPIKKKSLIQRLQFWKS